MGRPSTLSFAMAVTLAAPLVCTTLVSAADTRAGYAGGSGQLICLAEQPAIVEGEIAMLRAWVTTSAGSDSARQSTLRGMRMLVESRRRRLLRDGISLR